MGFIKENNSLLSSVFSYLRDPKYIASVKKSSFLKFWDVFRILSISLILSFIFAILISAALYLTGYDMGQHALSDPRFRRPDNIILLVIIFTPLLEETAFRLGLKFSPFRFCVSVSFFSFMALLLLDSVTGLNIFGSLTGLSLFVSLLIIVYVIGLVIKFSNTDLGLPNFYRNRFRLIFYSSVILFAGFHLTNYSNLNKIWFLAPLLIMPQLVGGFLLGYVRMHYGFHWSVFLHMSENALLTSTSLIFFFLPDDIAKFTQQDFIFLGISGVFLLLIASAILISFTLLLVEYFSYRNEKEHLSS